MLGVPPCIETVSGGSADALWPVTKDQILIERRLRVGRTDSRWRCRANTPAKLPQKW